MSKRNKLPAKELPANPINNFPDFDNDDAGLPDAVTLEIFSLRRRNAELGAKLTAANNKLTVALESLYSLRRFLSLWINEGQGESYDQVHARITRLEGTIDHLEDRRIGPAPEMEIPKRWKDKR